MKRSPYPVVIDPRKCLCPFFVTPEKSFAPLFLTPKCLTPLFLTPKRYTRFYYKLRNGFGSKSFLGVSYAILGNWRTKILKDLSKQPLSFSLSKQGLHCLKAWNKTFTYGINKINNMIAMYKSREKGSFGVMFLKKFLRIIWIAPNVS